MQMMNFTSTMTNSDEGDFYESHQESTAEQQPRMLTAKEKIAELE